MKEAILDFFVKGGPVMIPLTLVGLLIWFIGLLRIFWILRWNWNPERFACEGAPYWVKRAFTMAQERRGLPGVGLADSIGLVLARLEECLTRHVGVLKFLAQISTMLGFLGTVTGMVRTLRVISAGVVGIPQKLAGGLFEALYTTVYGLILALIGLGFVQIIEALAKSRIHKIERKIFDILDSDAKAEAEKGND